GSMHICDLDLNMLGANGIVGGGVPIAVGAGFANKYKGTDNVSVVFFGDGSTNIGAFHEAANMAAALSLPVVFVCENNEYGEYTPREQTMAITDVVDRAAGYGMPGVIADGMDVIAMYEAAGEAVARARAGEGPSFIEAKTYRFYNHHGVQVLGVKYRSDDELARWKKRDPIEMLEARLPDLGVMTTDEIEAVHTDVEAEVAEAIRFGQESPLPEADTLLEDVYSVAGGAQ
ncbi:MAG: thiamine pyrophosphate-dependent dehydrogenase E1 component subunit alpha, partial [Actinomycetia bacterium]|nr:thiamine pyrophosphate-dependent dehydrogenase E1 component subunit alpha [Actinomycetes bacterium]